MTFDYKALGLGQPSKDAHPECGVMVAAVVVIILVALALLFR